MRIPEVGLSFPSSLVAWFRPHAAVAQQPLSPAKMFQNGSANARQFVPSEEQRGSELRQTRRPDCFLDRATLIDVGVYNVPELATKARIGSNGDIYLPLVDYVHIAGLTPEEAQNLIQKKLADGGFVRNPHVNVFVDEHATGTPAFLERLPGQAFIQCWGNSGSSI